MNDIPENKPTTPTVVRSNAAESSWEAARSRQAATRAAVARHIDNWGGNRVGSIVPTEAAEGTIGRNVDGTDDAVATMKWRVLLLADALQRHALLKIAETGMILDEIDRAVAVAMRSDTEND